MAISNVLGIYFRRHGHFVASHPILVLVASFSFTVLCSLGLINFHWESNAIKLWIPGESDFAKSYNYLWESYPPDKRFHHVIFTVDGGKDILQPEYIRQMYNVRKRIAKINVDNKTWEDHCFQVPVVQVSLSSLLTGNRRRKRRVEDKIDSEPDGFSSDPFFGEDFEANFEDADPSVEFYPDPFCNVVNSMSTACYEDSILELWGHNGKYDAGSDKEMERLTREDILDKINNHNVSGLYFIEKDFTSFLGGVVRDANGKIVSAKAALFNFVGKMNGTAALIEGVAIDNAVGSLVDKSTLAFEKELVRVLTNKSHFSAGFSLYVNVARSFNDIASETIITDVTLVVIGFMIVFFYVIIMLGKFDLVQSRTWLAFAGLSSVYMAVAASYGICCTLGYPFSPLHNFIPFLLMGLGIDDMFVIVQSWNTFASPQKDRSLPERFGIALQQAGVAITITSLTDFIAFAIGSTTALCALQSFCMFCGVGILIVYLLQATWFLAWMTIDQRRIESRRNALMPCYKHKTDSRTTLCSSGGEYHSLLQRAFTHYSRFLLRRPVKICVILVTVLILGVGIWGNVLLRHEFDPMWFLPKDSYLSQWVSTRDKYFPSRGERVYVFMTDPSMPSELPNLNYMITELKNQRDIIAHVDSWFEIFQDYYEENFEAVEGVDFLHISEEIYRRRLTQFLYSPVGSKYRFMFRYESHLTCGKPAPNIQMFTLEFSHQLFENGPREQIPAMNRVKAIVADSNFTGIVFPFSMGYAAWETDEVIMEELYRNLGLAFMCVFATTFLLLSNLLACLQVLLCVVITLVNVAGFMHFWGLTIDTVSCVNLIICIGVCVDYAAHVAHFFLEATGCRDSRSGRALADIGPAVLNGGFSTFLSFVLLANSNSHVFDTFFKIFFLVVMFALFNGLVFLPVLLSLVGPLPRRADADASPKDPDVNDDDGDDDTKHDQEAPTIPDDSAQKEAVQLEELAPLNQRDSAKLSRSTDII